jgi:hypothetical protein
VSAPAVDLMRAEAAATELSRRALAEIQRRKKLDSFQRTLRSTIIARGRTDTPLIPQQQAALCDPARRKTWCCSRRAGKTAALARLIADTLEQAGFDQWVVFGARTLGIAKDIMWAELHALNKRYQLGWRMNDSELSIATSRGGRFRLFGVNDRKSLDKVRGKKYLLVICDEASTYEEFLEELIQKDFEAGLTDLDGVLILSGTPGYVKAGFWFKASQGQLGGWSNHHWTIFDNVYVEDVARKLREIRERNGWDEDHPTYIAEYLGRWVDNATMLVCDYLSTRNDIETLPEGYSLDWRHVIGIDYGSVDACAWEVIASDPYSGERYCVHDYAESGLIVDDSVDYTRRLVEQFKTRYVVADPGGGGKPFYETFNAKHGRTLGCTVVAADKNPGNAGLLGSIRLLNAELRTSRLKFYRPECVGVTADMKRLVWKDERRDIILENRDMRLDRFDALRYALHETLTWKAKDKPPTLDEASLAESLARAQRAKRVQQKSRRDWFESR